MWENLRSAGKAGNGSTGARPSGCRGCRPASSTGWPRPALSSTTGPPGTAPTGPQRSGPRPTCGEGCGNCSIRKAGNRLRLRKKTVPTNHEERVKRNLMSIIRPDSGSILGRFSETQKGAYFRVVILARGQTVRPAPRSLEGPPEAVVLASSPGLMAAPVGLVLGRHRPASGGHLQHGGATVARWAHAPEAVGSIPTRATGHTSALHSVLAWCDTRRPWAASRHLSDHLTLAP